MLKVLEGFHHRAERHIMGMAATCGTDEEWEYTLVVASMEDAGLHPITEYSRRRKATISKKVPWCPIYELYAKV